MARQEGVPSRIPASWQIAAGLLIAGMALLAVVVPPGTNAPAGRFVEDPTTGESRFVFDPPPGMTEGRILGQMSLFLLIGSLGLAYPRPLGRLLAPARRRRVHALLGALILALATVHAVVLPLVSVLRGWLSGVWALGALCLHGASGLLRGRLTGRWGPVRWRFVHVTAGWAGLLFGLEHALLFGQHLGVLRGVLGGA